MAKKHVEASVVFLTAFVIFLMVIMTAAMPMAGFAGESDPISQSGDATATVNQVDDTAAEPAMATNATDATTKLASAPIMPMGSIVPFTDTWTDMGGGTWIGTVTVNSNNVSVNFTANAGATATVTSAFGVDGINGIGNNTGDLNFGGGYVSAPGDGITLSFVVQITVTNVTNVTTVTATPDPSNSPSPGGPWTFGSAPPPTYALTVVGGTDTTAAGPYQAGTVISISATAPSGQKFVNWTSSAGGTFGDAAMANTTFTMPANAVTVTALFADNPVSENSSGTNSNGSGSDTNNSMTAQPAKVTAIRSAQTAFNIVKGKSLTIPYVVDREAGETKTPILTWMSSAPKNVSVTANGKVKGLVAGKSAKITVTSDNGTTKVFNVKVVKAAVKVNALSVSKPPKTMGVGQVKDLKAKITPLKATGAVVKFKSSKKSVVTVDSAGRMTAIKKGTARITVSVGSIKTVVTIRVK